MVSRVSDLWHFYLCLVNLTNVCVALTTPYWLVRLPTTFDWEMCSTLTKLSPVDANILDRAHSLDNFGDSKSMETAAF